jgi:hypothetical protein
MGFGHRSIVVMVIMPISEPFAASRKLNIFANVVLDVPKHLQYLPCHGFVSLQIECIACNLQESKAMAGQALQMMLLQHHRHRLFMSKWDFVRSRFVRPSAVSEPRQKPSEL